MKRSISLVLTLATFEMAPVWAAPTIGTTAATPTAIIVNQSTTVTVTSLITDPSLITTSVNLIRLNPTGSPTILGQLHDDGLNGDAVAGDQIYTLQAAFNQSAAGQIRLQVSAAFKGVLLRVLSNVMTILVGGQPTIAAVVSPPPNAAGWNNSPATVTFTCADPISGISSCTPPVTVSTEGGLQVVAGTATNNAGITASTFATVSLDKTAPALAIQSPSANSSLFAQQTPVAGTVSDLLSGLLAVSCNGIAAIVTASGFTCNLTLPTGPNTITVQASDVAGNVSTATEGVSVLPAPLVNFTSPANLSFLNTTPITVTGAVSDPNAAVTVNGIGAPSAGGNFAVTVPLNEGSNTLTAVAQNGAGNAGTASITVTLDTTPPHVIINAPGNNSVSTDAAITVTGTVNDIVPGTVNSQDAQVTVNGISAQVANRTFAAVNVPLILGANTIQAVARDRVGNAATASISVTRVSPTQPLPPAIGLGVITQSLSIVSGNNQTGTIGTALSAPLVVALRDASNNPVVNQPVVFKVTGNNGTLNGAPAAAFKTDANGQAQVSWTLGTRSGAGINNVQATSVLAAAPVNFTATAAVGNPALIVVDSGDNQTGVAGQNLPFPLAIVVTDAGNNRVPNVPVTFSVAGGGGNLAGASSQVINTDSDGRALAVLTLGLQAGNNNNLVQANFPGSTGSPVALSASAKIPGNPAATSISGTVLDNSNSPLQGVTMRLFLTNQGNQNNLPQQIGTPVVTDAQGQFAIPLAASGFYKLMADGSTITGGQSYPTLEYDIVPVSGQNNDVGTPIYLPALDTVGKLCVDPTHGGTLKLPQSPGFSLTVLAGSATFPGGSRTGCISVTPVHGDKVPMPPGFGQQPRFIVTIQPVGTTFNPPARITLPNVDGLPPKSVTEMYSYDHDLSMFVAIGTGTVSDDGSVIASNPGVGVLKAGWHCGGNPQPPACVGNCGSCRTCKGASCAPVSTADQCKDPDTFVAPQGVQVQFDDSCQGACVPNTGTCGPNGGGFSIPTMQLAVQQALNKVFDNSNTACIEQVLRKTLQDGLKQFGLFITCTSNSANYCGQAMNMTNADGSLGRTNEIRINTNAFSTAACEGNLPSTLLHEFIHAYGQDPGAPTGAYHDDTDGSPGKIIDCRDRVYGCQESCFPGSTAPKNLGNPQTCLLPQGSVYPGGPGCAGPAVPGCATINGVTICNTKQDCQTDPGTGQSVCRPVK